jgi:hypothetical protein
MIKILLLSWVLFLVGCETTKTVIVEKQTYVVRTAPESLKTIPEYPDTINVESDNQLDLANWIVLSEERQWALENIIKKLIEFYEAPIKSETK